MTLQSPSSTPSKRPRASPSHSPSNPRATSAPSSSPSKLPSASPTKVSLSLLLDRCYFQGHKELFAFCDSDFTFEYLLELWASLSSYPTAIISKFTCSFQVPSISQLHDRNSPTNCSANTFTHTNQIKQIIGEVEQTRKYT